MFQYAFGYLLSKQKETNFYAEGIPNFCIPSTFVFPPPPQRIETKMFGDHHADLGYLLHSTEDILVNSFLQKSSYYAQFRSELRRAFRVSQQQEMLHPDKLVLHVRETDYTDIGCFLGYEAYKQIIDKLGFSDVVVVTDNSTCDTVKRLVSDGCTLNTNGRVDSFTTDCDQRGMIDFCTLLCSENVAISQSSFSWWAAFLGEHKNVYFPFTKQSGMWKLVPEKDDIDLFYESSETHKIVI